MPDASVRRVMISCGEASGDLYASALVGALRSRVPGLRVSGFGGPRLAAAGATLTGTYDGLTVTGLVEAIRVLPRSFAMLRRIEDEARANRPDVFVAIDFPDFNFRLLPKMRALGVPVVYYIAPQLWAWRPSRMETIKKYVDRVLVIFPFEKEIYERAGVPVDFVGHPLIELANPTMTREALFRTAHLDPAKPVVALLPGSRPNEIKYVLPTLIDAVAKIHAAVPAAQFLIAKAPGVSVPVDLPAVTGMTDDVLASADVVITASGTATVQTALHEKPMVIVYRVAPLSSAILRRMITVQTYGMVNLVAGRAIVPEFVQAAFTPDAVANEVIGLLTNPARAESMRADLREMKARLGGPGATDRAADAILDVARTSRSR